MSDVDVAESKAAAAAELAKAFALALKEQV